MQMRTETRKKAPCLRPTSLQRRNLSWSMYSLRHSSPVQSRRSSPNLTSIYPRTRTRRVHPRLIARQRMIWGYCVIWRRRTDCQKWSLSFGATCNPKRRGCKQLSKRSRKALEDRYTSYQGRMNLGIDCCCTITTCMTLVLGFADNLQA